MRQKIGTYFCPHSGVKRVLQNRVRTARKLDKSSDHSKVFLNLFKKLITVPPCLKC